MTVASRFLGRVRGASAWASVAAAFAILAAANLLAGELLRGRSLDLTENRLFSISEGTRSALASLDEPLQLRLYYSSALGDAAPAYSRYFGRVRAMLESYRDLAPASIDLRILDPKPFSDTEDRAVAAELQGLALNDSGENGYFGLVASNSVDERETIPFFALDRESFLEYDLTKLLLQVASPGRIRVGLVTSLPMVGGLDPLNPSAPPDPTWRVVELMEELYETTPLLSDSLSDAGALDEFDLLMLVQPTDLDARGWFAIDQFALSGRPMLIFVDPALESAPSEPDKSALEANDPMLRLLRQWGVELDVNVVAGDFDSARRVRFSRDGQPVSANYLVWPALEEERLDLEDAALSGIKMLTFASSGILESADDAETDFRPLASTSRKSQRIRRSRALSPDPFALLDDFESGDESLTLAARVSGPIATLYPDGAPPPGEGDDVAAPADDVERDAPLQSGTLNAAVVADADMLFDSLWLRERRVFERRYTIPLAGNGDFALNLLESLAGGAALIGLRGRGVENRPFVLVSDLRREAEIRYRRREQTLDAKLRQLQDRIQEIVRQGRGDVSEEDGERRIVLSGADRDAVVELREEMIDVRQQLRAVKRALREDIDSLDRC